MENLKMLIDGELVESSNKQTAISIDPGNGDNVASYAFGGQNDAFKAINSARRAFDSGQWQKMQPSERASYIIKLAELMQENITRLSYIEACDSGGLAARTNFDVLQSIRFMRRMANYISKDFPWYEEIPKAAPLNPSFNYVLREPIGVCVAITPWNFPLLMAVWKITMAVLTGNTIILKPSPETPLSALILGELITKCQFPKGVINIITGNGKEIGEYLVEHPLVDRISFTGSNVVGQNIWTSAAKSMKRVSLELGGKSANIILEDANLDMAIDGAIFASFLHSGQVCESGTRLLIPESIAKFVIDAIVDRTRNIKVGYQLDFRTNMGPVISKKRLETIEKYIEIGKKEGAKLLTGGSRIQLKGFENGNYMSPAIFTDVQPDMTIAKEEIFGPVLSILTYKNEEDAINIANNSKFGLAAGIWSKNIKRAEQIAARLKAGTVWINDWHIFNDFGPFGGYKQSGIGRELGKYGLESFTEIKHVHIGTEGEADSKIGHRTLLLRDQPIGYEHIVPTKIISGPGSISRLRSEINSTRMILITDKGILATGIIEQIYNIIGNQIAVIFDNVLQDAGLSIVYSAVDLGRKHGVNAVLSVGGGSVIDTGKAVSIALGLGMKASEIIGMNHLEGIRLPHYVVPTTAGSGSEVTNVAVLKNEYLNQKFYIFDKMAFPDIAVLDPNLTISLSKELTAYTAMDALTHAIEAFTSKKSNPFSDSMALHAITLIINNLEIAIVNGNDINARSALLSASNLAGMAISSARVGLVHAMSHALGAKYGISHGIGCGLLLPHVIRWNSQILNIAERYLPIAQAAGINILDNSHEVSIKALIEKIQYLLEAIGHPTKLSHSGISNQDIKTLAIYAFSDLSILTNARTVYSIEEIEEIYNNAF